MSLVAVKCPTITEGMIRRAIKLIAPTAESILFSDEFSLPSYVRGFVAAPNLVNPGPQKIPFSLGGVPKSGSQDNFAETALQNLELAIRIEGSPGKIIREVPWVFTPEERLCAGAVYRDGIVVAISGAKEQVNEALAEMLISAIVMLARLTPEPE